ncbi:LON peptidase substrate-binding domain-containing protein [Verrucomicrobiota bacterium sgz303538]
MLCPVEPPSFFYFRVKSIQDQTLNLPSEAPIMVLSGALLFPHALLPLYIFEPRYRAMLRHALERDRMFCIAQPRPGVEEPEGPEDFCDVSGLGLVRACVGNGDGTSHLVLQGLARVRFRGIVQERPFRVAQIQELRPQSTDSIETEPLMAQLLQLCAEAPSSGPEDREKFEEQLGKISDPGVLCDIVAHTFLREPFHRQAVLDTLDVSQRLRLVTKFLRAEQS